MEVCVNLNGENTREELPPIETDPKYSIDNPPFDSPEVATPRGSVKAIETRYKRHYFRSRLEARWAVFFDSMGIQWEYEPEGFSLSNGVRYLPDFYLPQVRWFCEIKPNLHVFHTEDKIRPFVLETGQAVLLLAGPPGFIPFTGFECFDHMVTKGDYSLDIVSHPKHLAEGRLWSDFLLCIDIPAEENFSRQYIDAVEEALSARFE